MAASASSTEERLCIEENIDVEEVEPNLFRSVKLWIPRYARGAYGGQVMAQAAWSACLTVDSAYKLHALQANFIGSCKATPPVIYHVKQISNGRSYAIRSVVAKQSGNNIFVLMASFQKTEANQLYKVNLPVAYPPGPSECPHDATSLHWLMSEYEPGDKRYQLTKTVYPSVEMRIASSENENGPEFTPEHTWMKIRQTKARESAMKRCILVYLSDFDLIPSGPRALGISRRTRPRKTDMLTSLNHTMHIISDEFDLEDWLLYQKNFHAAQGGRILVNGSFHSMSGTPLAICSQEGVFRTSVVQNETSAKL